MNQPPLNERPLTGPQQQAAWDEFGRTVEAGRTACTPPLASARIDLAEWLIRSWMIAVTLIACTASLGLWGNN